MLDYNSNFEYITLKVENNRAYFPLRICLRAFQVELNAENDELFMKQFVLKVIRVAWHLPNLTLGRLYVYILYTQTDIQPFNMSLVLA